MTKYVCSQELRESWDCTRQAISNIANREGWRVRNYDRPHWYNVDDVQLYLLSKDHSKRARSEHGLKFRGLIRHNELGYNEDCPVCNAIA
jgi:hypothetical protein